MSKQVAICIDSPALGDTLAAIPTLRKLSKVHESQLVVFSSHPILFENHPLVSKTLKLDDPLRFDGSLKVYRTFMPIVGNTHDLRGEKVEFRHTNMDIRQFHAVSLGFTLTEDEMETDIYIENEREIGFEDYVIIHPTHTWPTRTWDQEKWQELVDRLNARGIPVIAVGRDSKEVGTFSVEKPVMDINIKLGLNLLNDSINGIPELRWMMNHKAKALVTMDSGVLHIAGTTDVNIIQLGSSIDPKLRAPYRKGSQDYKYTYVAGGCNIFCSSNMKYNVKEHGTINGIPPQIFCLENKPTFECHPSVDKVFDAVVNLYDVKPKIRLIHLLLNDDLSPERQERSIESISKLKDRGIEYIQVWNDRWKDTPPRETYAYPEDYDSVPITAGHYGNYRAFKDSGIEHFTEDIDALIWAEGDAFFVKPIDEIIEDINRAYVACESNNISYFNFGSRYSAHDTSELVSDTRYKIDDIHVVNKAVCAHFCMLHKRVQYYCSDRFLHEKWTAADIYLNNLFMGKFNIGMFEEPIALQSDGISAIDNYKKIHSDTRSSLDFKELNKPALMTPKKKLLFLAPHLSTGGMPQFVLKRVEAMLDVPEYDVHLVEYTQYSNIYNVQRDQLIEKLGDKFHSLGFLDTLDITERGENLIAKVLEINPDIIHIDECPESFDGFNKLDQSAMDWLYNKEWKVIETSHNIWFDPKDKVNDPDMYMMCTPHHLETFSERAGLKPVVEYPIIDKTPSTLERAKSRGKLGFSIDKTHILNVGLWTAGKNQSEGVDIARIVEAQFPGKYHFHFVGNQAENFERYWKPIMDKLPDNVTVWGERTDVDVFMSACDAFMFNSTWECSPLALREAIGYGLITFSRDLPQYKDMFTPYIVPFSNDLHENVDQLIRTLKSSKAQGKNIPTDDLKRFTTQLKEAYGMVLNTKRGPQKPPTLKPAKWTLTYQDGPKLTIDQAGTEPLRAEFWDGEDLIYAPEDLQSNSWYKPARNWWTQWHVKLYNGDRLVHTEAVSLEGRELTVEMASSSLGDTLAFMGQLHTVIDTHKLSRVYVKTHKPWLFDKAWYSKQGIDIIDWSVPNRGAVITIGVFYTMEEPWKRAEHKYDWRTITLGKIAADRLGVEYVEQRPQLAPEFLIKSRNKTTRPSIVIATHSTAQAKYWNNPTGWQETIDWCNKEGVKVYHASKEGTELTGVQQLPEELALVAAAINDATMFIGISSGLSWFAWALGAKVVIISGFTDPYVEFESATYVNNHHVCHGCWGWDTFDKGDWNWCPSWKGTQRQFECTKTIGSDRVIEVITKQVYG